VTAKTSSGFWFEDPAPDGDPATSEGLFVFGSTAAGRVAVGDAVEVSGNITEFRPGGSSTANLTTELTSPFVTVVSSGNALPAATVELEVVDVAEDDDVRIGVRGQDAVHEVVHDLGLLRPGRVVSGNLLETLPIAYDVVHVNSEFADPTSDHEPQVARLDLTGRPTAE
jgi:hypothetical protein